MGGVNDRGNLVELVFKDGRRAVYAYSLLPWLALSGDVERAVDVATGRIVYEDDEKALG